MKPAQAPEKKKAQRDSAPHVKVNVMIKAHQQQQGNTDEVLK